MSLKRNISKVLETEIMKDEPQENSMFSRVKLTPTGKISHAKTRVYTQRYRQDWEKLPEFQGWLTSIPLSPTRAYCLYCKKDLHAHRLSLLKHTCTMKHQRATLSTPNNGDPNSVNIRYLDSPNDHGKEEFMNVEYLEDGDIQYVVERLDMTDVGMDYSGNDRNDESFEEVEDEPAGVDDVNNTPQEFEMVNTKRDTLAEAMAQIHSDNEMEEHPEEVDMIVIESNTEDTPIKSTETNIDRQAASSNKIVLQNESITKLGDEVLIIKKQSQTARKSLKKVLSKPGSNSVTIAPTNKIVTFQGNRLDTDSKISSVRKGIESPVIENAQTHVQNENLEAGEASDSLETIVKETTVSRSNSSYKKSCITTHVIDTNKGVPIGGLQVSLYKLVDGRWTFINESSTMVNGHCNDLVDHDKTNFTAGRYKLHFDVDKYFTCRKIETMFPFIEIVFDVKNPIGSYHIPMLLSPYCYTVHRGCDK